MTHQPELIPDQPSPEQVSRDAERAEYLERLREKLKDPDFRAIEGFPIGEDEDILTLSDPPCYTACLTFSDSPPRSTKAWKSRSRCAQHTARLCGSIQL
jgi:hypothetical protein